MRENRDWSGCWHRRRSKPIAVRVRSGRLGHPMKKKKKRKKPARSEAGKTKTSVNCVFMLCEWTMYVKDRKSALLFTYFPHFIIVS